jgi:threonine synthase
VKIEPFQTIATTLGAIMATDMALLTLRETSGAAVRVTDEEIRRAQRRLLEVGMFIEPAGAAGVAALSHLPEELQGYDPDQSRVVVLLTGGGLRSLSAVPPDTVGVEAVDPTPDALERSYARWSAARSRIRV